MAGRLSTEGYSVFWSTFGAFAGAEAYNQERLNDYNDATVKVVATHCGLDVGEDGPGQGGRGGAVFEPEQLRTVGPHGRLLNGARVYGDRAAPVGRWP